MEKIIGKQVTYKGAKYTVMCQTFSSYDGTTLEIFNSAVGTVYVSPHEIGYTERLANPETTHTFI